MHSKVSSSQTRPHRQQKPGQLRQDLITGKWVTVATSRSKRPTDFSVHQSQSDKLAQYVSDCPFCNLGQYPQEPDLLRLPADPDRWEVHIFGNKYPAFLPRDQYRAWQTGPYHVMEAVGHHELLATRQHDAIDAYLTYDQMSLQLEALVLRYRQLKDHPTVSYVQIIKNHGRKAGASLAHPHHQIFTTPIIPSDIQDLLNGAARYAATTNQEVFSAIVNYELQSRQRLVCENDDFIAFCPYASRVSFEVWVMPKEPNPHFDHLSPDDRDSLAEMLVTVLAKLRVGLGSPAYNYYILSAPCGHTTPRNKTHAYHHWRWHIQILPRLNVWGGFEIGTGLEIIDTLPEESAAFLREQKIEIN